MRNLKTALRLARYFKTNAEFWLNLQNFCDLERERRAGKCSQIERQVQPVGRLKVESQKLKSQRKGKG
jgi:plasmid maintenance system antidote protein VapI